jgi:hypothetical protein
VNIYFYRVIAKNYQGWSTCQDYIEIKTERIKKNNLEDSGRKPLEAGAYLASARADRLSPRGGHLSPSANEVESRGSCLHRL